MNLPGNLACVSPNGKYLLYINNQYLELYDLIQNNIKRSVQIDSAFQPIENITIFMKSISTFKVSDNGICLFNSNGKYYIYDILNTRPIISAFYNCWKVEISPDLQYFAGIFNKKIVVYKVSTDTAVIVSDIPLSSYFTRFGFYPDQTHNLFYFDSPTLTIWSCENKSKVNSFLINKQFYNIDFSYDKVLSSDSCSKWQINDLNNGTILQTINSEFGIGTADNTLLNENSIFYNGYIYPLAP